MGLFDVVGSNRGDPYEQALHTSLHPMTILTETLG
jgi:hypothetical protein